MKKLCYKVERHGMGVCVFGTSEEAAEEVRQMSNDEVGDKLTVEIVEMTELEFKALPEFQGW